MLSASKLPAVKPIKNVFTFLQIKKMIGKKLIIPWKGLTISPQELKDNAKKMKKKIMESALQTGGNKKIVLTTVCINGVLNIVNGIDRSTAISMISYKEMQKLDMSDIKIIVVQYPQMSQAGIKNIILLP